MEDEKNCTRCEAHKDILARERQRADAAIAERNRLEKERTSLLLRPPPGGVTDDSREYVVFLVAALKSSMRNEQVLRERLEKIQRVAAAELFWNSGERA